MTTDPKQLLSTINSSVFVAGAFSLCFVTFPLAILFLHHVIQLCATLFVQIHMKRDKNISGFKVTKCVGKKTQGTRTLAVTAGKITARFLIYFCSSTKIASHSAPPGTSYLCFSMADSVTRST